MAITSAHARISAEQVAYLRRVKAAEPNSLAAKTRGSPQAHGLYLMGYIAITHEAGLPGVFHVLTPRARDYLDTIARAARIVGCAAAAGKAA